MDNILTQLYTMFPTVMSYFTAGFIIFSRMIGFIRFAPVFNRKEIPGIVKIALAMMVSVIFTMVLHPTRIPANHDLILLIVTNFAVGAAIGYIAQLILIAIEAGGDMINMQMGLSSAMVLDPTTSSQTSILSRLIMLLGLIIFINMGGIYWIFRALLRSFEIFPIFSVQIPLAQLINLDYLVSLSSNVLFMGLQIASPVLLATLGQDIILGIISRTAPQINVFQLSFLFKPVLGAAIMIWILPILVNVISEYFLTFSHIF